MNFFGRFYTLFTVLLLCALNGISQDAAIGEWSALLPYNSAVGVATDGTTLFTIGQAFFTYNSHNGEGPVAYSKVQGMSGIGMQSIGYDAATGTLILSYTDGNIDLFKDNTFYNIPDLKQQVLFENKQVFHIYAENGTAYLCTSVGIMVIDLIKRLVTNTWPLYLNNEVSPVNSLIGNGKYFYIIPRTGLYRIDKNNTQISLLQAWQCMDSTDTFFNIAAVYNQLFFSTKKTVFTLTAADTLQQVYSSADHIQHIDGGYNNLMIGVSRNPGGAVKIMNMAYTVVDSFDCTDSMAQAVQLSDSSIWVAVPNGGLEKRTATNQTKFVFPDGPSSPYTFDLYAYNRNLYIAHGGYSSAYFANHSYNGFSNYNNGKWKLYKRGSYPLLDNSRDFTTITKDESTGTLYAGSYLDGLFVENSDTSSEVIGQNSVFDGSIAYGSDAHQILGLGLDRSDNLWVSMMFSRHQLYAKTKDGTWYKYLVPAVNYGGPLAIDDSGQIWFVCSAGLGIAVFNTNKTLGDIADDASYHFIAGIGYGNLPSNAVYCIAKDKKNQMWVGTDNGIGIVKNCIARQNTTVCDAEIPLDNVCSLFVGQIVTSIIVDDLDRKWIGTHHGVWLISADAQQVIYHFTAANSPLPSDLIQKMCIDGLTGDVYIGTDEGLVSYHATVTDGNVSGGNTLVFPNPVPPGYSGSIAIRGVPANADVRITDINGQLVYHTKAQGGQAIWDGRDYTGRRPQTGVYPFFVSSGDGRHTSTGKIVFIQ
jgi:hypothetical protein